MACVTLEHAIDIAETYTEFNDWFRTTDYLDEVIGMYEKFMNILRSPSSDLKPYHFELKDKLERLEVYLESLKSNPQDSKISKKDGFSHPPQNKIAKINQNPEPIVETTTSNLFEILSEEMDHSQSNTDSIQTKNTPEFFYLKVEDGFNANLLALKNSISFDISFKLMSNYLARIKPASLEEYNTLECELEFPFTI